jgi:hypothetical protein
MPSRHNTAINSVDVGDHDTQSIEADVAERLPWCADGHGDPPLQKIDRGSGVSPSVLQNMRVPLDRARHAEAGAILRNRVRVVLWNQPDGIAIKRE